MSAPQALWLLSGVVQFPFIQSFHSPYILVLSLKHISLDNSQNIQLLASGITNA
jgi:hypothetical protein